MRNLLLFILISVSKISIACGFYPYGEETRFSIFNPRLFGYSTFAEFYYSSNSYGSYYSDTLKYPSNYVEPNIKLWYDYCAGKIDMHAVGSAVYNLSIEEMTAHSPNEMIRYLYDQKDVDALNYLRFAKDCEFFNSWQEDPWERQKYMSMPMRTELMNKAIAFAGKVQNKDLKKRYTFLAIRLAWYNHHYDKVQSLFASCFEKTRNKDILYYWSLYFKGCCEKDSALANFELAQVFANAVDKRFVCHQHFNTKVTLENALKYATLNEEKANVYVLAAIEKYDKTLSYLQKIYATDPSSSGLSFLLLREINKIEDFVFTPYYTLFQPSLSYNPWEDEGENTSIQQTLKRSEGDRIYAKEVLLFINGADLSKVENPNFWLMCKSYLQFITRDYDNCLVLVNQLEKTITNKTTLNQVQLIKAMAIIAKQKSGQAVIPIEIQPIILQHQKNAQFIFAIAKELEYLGNTTDAALLYSKLNRIFYDENSDNGSRVLFWKTIKSTPKTISNYFSDYFDYVDVAYTPEQVEHLINTIQINASKKDSFSLFKFDILKLQIPRLYDLLGTKYIRQNNLSQALAAFEKAGHQYWNRSYTTWEDYGNIFDQNPFYELKYTPQFIAFKDSIRLNKYTVIKQLIQYLDKAQNKQEKDKDYYYFLVANAYYNMGREGNVWMMRRFSSWSAYSLSDFDDEIEFRQSNLAKQYYLLAMQYATTDQFKALCLRMIVRCEKHKIEFKEIDDSNDYNNNLDSKLARNKYYLELKTKYPQYFNDLVSNCEQFASYFEARR